MITDITRDEVTRLLKSTKDLPGIETIAENTVCEVFDSILDHLLLEHVEEAIQESSIDEDTGTDADAVYAHQAMHWAFQLGVALGRDPTIYSG